MKNIVLGKQEKNEQGDLGACGDEALLQKWLDDESSQSATHRPRRVKMDLYTQANKRDGFDDRAYRGRIPSNEDYLGTMLRTRLRMRNRQYIGTWLVGVRMSEMWRRHDIKSTETIALFKYPEAGKYQGEITENDSRFWQVTRWLTE